MRTDVPFEYGGPHDPPTLSPATDALYLALKTGEALPARAASDVHLLSADLTVIAERLECDYQALRLRGRIECRAGWGDRRDTAPEGLGLHAVAVCVTIYWRDEEGRRPRNRTAQLNSVAAARIADRLDSGLAAGAAIRRTLEQCHRETYTDAEVRQREARANAWTATLADIDARYSHAPGSAEHLAAIRQASAAMP